MKTLSDVQREQLAGMQAIAPPTLTPDQRQSRLIQALCIARAALYEDGHREGYSPALAAIDAALSEE